MVELTPSVRPGLRRWRDVSCPLLRAGWTVLVGANLSPFHLLGIAHFQKPLHTMRLQNPQHRYLQGRQILPRLAPSTTRGVSRPGASAPPTSTAEPAPAAPSEPAMVSRPPLPALPRPPSAPLLEPLGRRGSDAAPVAVPRPPMWDAHPALGVDQQRSIINPFRVNLGCCHSGSSLDEVLKLTVPAHCPVKRSTLFHILKWARLDVERFLELL